MTATLRALDCRKWRFVTETAVHVQIDITFYIAACNALGIQLS